MKEDKEKWIEEVIGSMKGSDRAKPKKDLFNKIAQDIEKPIFSIVPRQQWRAIAAVGLLLIALNVFALYQLSTQDKGMSNLESKEQGNYYHISDYNIYK